MSFIHSFSLKLPFKVTLTWDFSLFNLVSSQNVIIIFKDERKTSCTHNPPHNPITTADAKDKISSFRLITSILNYIYHPTNRAFTTSPVTKKSCFLITTIRKFGPLMNLPSQSPRLGHSISVKFTLSLQETAPPITNTPAPYILAHSIGSFLMIYHYKRPTYLPFMRYNLKVTPAPNIPTSSFKG